MKGVDQLKENNSILNLQIVDRWDDPVTPLLSQVFMVFMSLPPLLTIVVSLSLLTHITCVLLVFPPLRLDINNGVGQWTYEAMVHELIGIHNNRIDLSNVRLVALSSPCVYVFSLLMLYNGAFLH